MLLQVLVSLTLSHTHIHTFDVHVYYLAAVEVNYSFQNLLRIFLSQHLAQFKFLPHQFLYGALQIGYHMSSIHTHAHMHACMYIHTYAHTS